MLALAQGKKLRNDTKLQRGFRAAGSSAARARGSPSSNQRAGGRTPLALKDRERSQSRGLRRDGPRKPRLSIEELK